jgi:hypothetical protein
MSNIKSTMFAAYNNSFASVEANTEGSGAGWRPDAGDHAVLVTGMTIEEGDFKQKDGQVFPSIDITFQYQMVEDPGSPEPRSFTGARFNLPSDPTQLTDEGAKTRNRIELERIKGHLTTLIGRRPENLQMAMQTVQERINNGNVIPVKLRARYDESKVKPGTKYFKEFLVSPLSLA